jgi:hypothetical protein
MDPSKLIEDHIKFFDQVVEAYSRFGMVHYKSKLTPEHRLYDYKKQVFKGSSTVTDFDQPKTLESHELLRDCYGLSRQQRQNTCWLDATLELFSNGDTIGEIFRSEIFEYGLFNGNQTPVPYMVKTDFVKDDLQSFIFYIIFNFVLFNLEITNGDLYNISEDKVRLPRQYSNDICGFSFGIFMDAVKDIFSKDIDEKNVIILVEKLLSNINRIPLGGEDKTRGGYTDDFNIFLTSLINNIPNMTEYIESKELNMDAKKIVRLSSNIIPDIFIGLLLINTIRIKINMGYFTIRDLHLTNISRCHDKIFFYDNNKKINAKTKSRSIELNTDLFWKDKIDYIKNFYSNYGYTKDDPTDLIFTNIYLLNKKKDYHKTINLKNISGSSMKKVLLDIFLANTDELISRLSPRYNKIRMQLRTIFIKLLDLEQNDDQTPDEIIKNYKENLKTTKNPALYKYLKYKHKYLSLLKNSNI